jgi:hypothetical protein
MTKWKMENEKQPTNPHYFLKANHLKAWPASAGERLRGGTLEAMRTR